MFRGVCFPSSAKMGVASLEKRPCCFLSIFIVFTFFCFLISFCVSFILTYPGTRLYPAVPQNDLFRDYYDDDIGKEPLHVHHVDTTEGPVVHAAISKLNANINSHVEPTVKESTEVEEDNSDSDIDPSIFNGYYTHYKDDRFEELLEALNLGFLTRRAILLAHPSVEVQLQGGNWTILTHLPFMTLENKFRLGEQVNVRNPSGEVLCVFTLDKNRLIQTPVNEDGLLKIDRIFLKSKRKMITKMVHIPTGLTAINYYNRTAD